MMNDHYRDALLFFGLGLAVVSNLEMPRGILFVLFKWTSMGIALLCMILGVTYFFLGSKSKSPAKVAPRRKV